MRTKGGAGSVPEADLFLCINVSNYATVRSVFAVHVRFVDSPCSLARQAAWQAMHRKGDALRISNPDFRAHYRSRVCMQIIAFELC